MPRVFLIISLIVIAIASLLVLLPRGSDIGHAPMVSSGEALIGGKFALTDQHGKRVRDTDLRGKFMLVFFGFTHCQDICPIGTATMSAAMDALKADSKNIAPVFITLDPARDTPRQLAEFLKPFHKNFIGLTGSEAEIKQVAGEYRAYYAKAKTGNVDHSGFIYLMDKQGKYLAHFPYSIGADELAKNLREAMKP